MSTSTRIEMPAAQDERATLCVGFELSRSTWLIGVYAPDLGPVVSREYERLCLTERQIREIEATQAATIKATAETTAWQLEAGEAESGVGQAALLMRLKGQRPGDRQSRQSPCPDPRHRARLVMGPTPTQERLNAVVS